MLPRRKRLERTDRIFGVWRIAALGLGLSTGSALGGAMAPQSSPFPGAHTWAASTPGGRGGKIIRVTNLNPEGPGSVREAVETKGPRIVVFEVGGVIDLDKKSIRITEPFLTIAGQTAPEPRITFIRGKKSRPITSKTAPLPGCRICPISITSEFQSRLARNVRGSADQHVRAARRTQGRAGADDRDWPERQVAPAHWRKSGVGGTLNNPGRLRRVPDHVSSAASGG